MLCGTIAAGSVNAAAATAVVYSNTFSTTVDGSQKTISSHWSFPSAPEAEVPRTKWTTVPVEAGKSESFLGPFDNGSVRLDVGAVAGKGLPAHSSVRVELDFLALLSLDGNVHDEDFTITIDGQQVLHSNFDSCGGRQAYPGSRPTGDYTTFAGDYAPYRGRFTGYAACFNDATYKLSFDLAHTSPTLAVEVAGANLQGWADEGWGLDNVKVTVDPVASTASNLRAINVESSVGEVSAGQTLPVSTIVDNNGSATSPSGVVKYYLNADPVRRTFDTADNKRHPLKIVTSPSQPTVTAPIGPLAPGAQVTYQHDALIPGGVVPGYYYLETCLVITPDQSGLDNCRHSASPVYVHSPDLVVADFSIGDGTNPPPDAHVGDTISVVDNTWNVGDAVAGELDPAFSDKAWYVTSSGPGTWTKVAPLRDGNRKLIVKASAPLYPWWGAGGTFDPKLDIAGTFHIMVCADQGLTVSGETRKVLEADEQNNCKVSNDSITVLAN